MDKLTPDDAFELGNQFRDAAIALGDWRIRNRASLSKAQWDELDSQEITLLNTASSIYTGAIGLVLSDSQPALERLQSSVKDAKSAVNRIVGLKQALDLASALVLLAGALYSGNAAAIPGAIVALEDAAEAIALSYDPGSKQG
jgi:hypothetical protein